MDRRLLIAPLLALSLTGCAAKAPPANVILTAKDGVKVYCDFVKGPPSKAVVLMFHQAGSNAGEYTPIAPEISKLGFDCLLVDQRSGGSMFRRKNRTASEVKGNPSYLDAYQDLEAAVSWAKGKGYKRIVAWGSSYSAALTLRLATEPGLTAAVAFSPGEYIGAKGTVAGWAAQAKCPVFLAATPQEVQESVQGFYTRLPAKLRAKSLLITQAQSVHGSSTLRPDKNPLGYRFFQSAVTGWLRTTIGP